MIKNIPLSKIKLNPNNPRFIKDKDFKDLVKSLKDFPKMTEIREVVVNKDMMILGGNMRFQAAKELGWKTIPVKIVDLSPEEEKEFIIKDNLSKGEWDWELLEKDWDLKLLTEEC